MTTVHALCSTSAVSIDVESLSVLISIDVESLSVSTRSLRKDCVEFNS